MFVGNESSVYSNMFADKLSTNSDYPLTKLINTIQNRIDMKPIVYLWIDYIVKLKHYEFQFKSQKLFSPNLKIYTKKCVKDLTSTKTFFM